MLPMSSFQAFAVLGLSKQSYSYSTLLKTTECSIRDMVVLLQWANFSLKILEPKIGLRPMLILLVVEVVDKRWMSLEYNFNLVLSGFFSWKHECDDL